jgi:hypothetical protein
VRLIDNSAALDHADTATATATDNQTDTHTVAVRQLERIG